MFLDPFFFIFKLFYNGNAVGFFFQYTRPIFNVNIKFLSLLNSILITAELGSV